MPNDSTKLRRVSKRGGATIRAWWSALLAEHDDGTPVHTVEALWKIAEAENADTQISAAKRIAARHIVEAVKGGRRGIDALQMIFDRLEGKPQQSVQVSGHLTADPAAQVTEETLRKIRAATNSNGAEADI